MFLHRIKIIVSGTLNFYMYMYLSIYIIDYKGSQNKTDISFTFTFFHIKTTIFYILTFVV